jgi:hypothetical protein
MLDSRRFYLLRFFLNGIASEQLGAHCWRALAEHLPIFWRSEVGLSSLSLLLRSSRFQVELKHP